MRDLFQPSEKLSPFHPLTLIQIVFVVLAVEVLNFGHAAITFRRIFIVCGLSLVWAAVSFLAQKYILRKRVFSDRFYLVNAFLFPVILIGITWLLVALFG